MREAYRKLLHCNLLQTRSDQQFSVRRFELTSFRNDPVSLSDRLSTLSALIGSSIDKFTKLEVEG